jgi:hypothetical protein
MRSSLVGHQVGFIYRKNVRKSRSVGLGFELPKKKSATHLLLLQLQLPPQKKPRPRAPRLPFPGFSPLKKESNGNFLTGLLAQQVEGRRARGWRH